MRIVFRKILREILKYFCIIAINKHRLEIIAVGGWYGTDIAREAVYSILKSNGKNVRRAVHSPQIDWDIPLTILGIKGVPSNIFSWLYNILLTALRLIILKPNPTIVVLQVNAQDAGIMKYWMSFLTPDVVIMLNSHVGTLNLELLIVEKLKERGMLILNNDNLRTKSLAQGRVENVLYFGENNVDNEPDYYFEINKQSHSHILDLGHAKEVYSIKKAFPEFSYPFLASSVAISSYYSIPFKDTCSSLDFFELPSDKIKRMFNKFIEE